MSDLSIRSDPFSTAAELARIFKPERRALRRFLSMPTDQRPTLVAFPGYDDPWGRRFFYKAPDGWRDTLSEALWQS